MVQLELPDAKAVQLLRQIPGFENFDPQAECLNMVRPGFGLKDAPRLWSMRLDAEFKILHLLPSITDTKFYMMHGSTRAQAHARDCASGRPEHRLKCVASAHVDDVKGASSRETANFIMDHLEKVFGKLTRQWQHFEYTGIWHDQHEDFSVHTSQDHYVKVLRPIKLDRDEAAEQSVVESGLVLAFNSLLGGIAWTLVTRGDVSVHVGYLQRAAHNLKWKHLKMINTILRWMKRKS